MLVQVVTYTFPAEKIDEAEQLLRQLRAGSVTEPGCIDFDVCRGDGEASGTFVLYETWRDESALEEHYKTDHFQRFGVNGIRPLASSRHAIHGTPVE
jgi:quinol monooxygenase YgiN